MDWAVTVISILWRSGHDRDASCSLLRTGMYPFSSTVRTYELIITICDFRKWDLIIWLPDYNMIIGHCILNDHWAIGRCRHLAIYHQTFEQIQNTTADDPLLWYINKAKCLRQHISIRSFRALTNDHMSVSHIINSHFHKLAWSVCTHRYMTRAEGYITVEECYMTISVMNSSTEDFCHLLYAPGFWNGLLYILFIAALPLSACWFNCICICSVYHFFKFDLLFGAYDCQVIRLKILRMKNILKIDIICTLFVKISLNLCCSILSLCCMPLSFL